MKVTTYSGELPQPIRILESFLEQAGTSVIRAAFAYSFFVDPQRVAERTPYFPGRARMSREHYPQGDRGHTRQWEGQDVRLGDNARAQMAWAKYTSRPIARGSGYGVRHIWGNPWDPFAFTAGWNLCYMPFWVGMLTEDQHPHEELVRAIQQASFDLFFRDEPVCARPNYVTDHGLDLDAILEGAPVQTLSAERKSERRAGLAPAAASSAPADPAVKVVEIRKAANASWANILKALASLQEQPHEPFGTINVANSSKSVVRRMARETQLGFGDLESLVRQVMKGT